MGKAVGKVVVKAHVAHRAAVLHKYSALNIQIYATYKFTLARNITKTTIKSLCRVSIQIIYSASTYIYPLTSDCDRDPRSGFRGPQWLARDDNLKKKGRHPQPRPRSLSVDI
jgi:hypothetical protein